MPALPLIAGVLATMSDPAAPAFTPADLWALPRVSSPRLSPDGHVVVYEVATFDGPKRTASLWTVSTRDGAVRRLTAGPTDRSPRWHDAAVWFLSDRSGSSQVWRIDPTGGEATQVTTLPLDVSAFEVAARHVVVLLRAFPDALDPQASRTRVDALAARGDSAHVHEGGFARHWDAWADGRTAVPYAVPIDGGAPVALSPPASPTGDATSLAIHPSGRAVVWIASDRGGEAWSTSRDLWMAPLDPPATGRRVHQHDASLSSPAFSADGKQLALLHMSTPGYESDRNRIAVAAWTDQGPGSLRPVADAWDRSPHEVGWLDSSTLWATADDGGRGPLFRVDTRNGAVATLTSTGTASQANAAGGRAVFVHDALDASPEIAWWNGRAAMRLTQTQPTSRLGSTEPFRFEGAHGDTVSGWLVRPAVADPSGRSPLALVVHGGPQGSFGDHWHWRWSAQALAGAGYAVVLIDFHGSTGYGQAFTDSISGDWGGAPLKDLQLGLDAVLAAHPWIDGTRAAALGGSYGGYMMNWIAGQWPDRFRCLVNHAGVFSTRGLAFDTEELFFPGHDFGGMPWQVPEAYDRVDPSRFVDRWKAPMLVLHGRKDFRVTESHALGTYNALQRQGIPVRLVVFDEGSHWIQRAPDGLLWWNEVLGWLERWTR